jgi:hypothetical protein
MHLFKQLLFLFMYVFILLAGSAEVMACLFNSTVQAGEGNT